MDLKVWQIFSVYGVICPRALLLTTIPRWVCLRVSLLLHKTLRTGCEGPTLPVGRGQLAGPILILSISPVFCRSRGSLGHPVLYKCRINVGIHPRISLEALSMGFTPWDLE